MSIQTPNRNVYDDEGKSQPLIDDTPPGSKVPTGDPADQIKELNDSFYGPDGESRYGNTDNLEKQAKLDSHGYDQDQPSSKASSGAASRDELESQEENASADNRAQGKVPAAEAASFVKPGTSFGKKAKSKVPFVGRFKNKAKQKTAAVLITGLLAGGGIVGFQILQGPLQLMHLSQILQRPLAGQERDTETRMHALFRFAKTGELGHTRLTYLGSRSVEKTNARLKDIGVTVKEKTGAGRPMVYEIDSRKYAPGTSAETTAKAFLRANPGIPSDHVVIPEPRDRGGIIQIRDPKGGPIDDKIVKRVDKGVIGELFKGRKLGKTITAIKSRPVTRFNGSYPKWHPWQRAKVRIGDSTVNTVKARQAKKAERGERANTRVAKFKDKVKPGATGAGVIAGVSAAQLGVCLAKDIAKETPLLSHENVVQPAKNEAVELISFGEQERSNRDFHISQPGAEVQGLKDKKGRTVWESRPLNALANGDGGHGEDLPEDTKAAFSSRSPEQDVSDAMGGADGIVCSTGGQIAGGVIGAAALIAAAPTGGGSAAAFTAVTVASAAGTMAAVAAITTLVPKLLADKPPAAEMLESAPFRGSFAAIGSVDLANDFYRKAGGSEMSANATADVHKIVMQEEQEEFRSKSFMSRMFDLNDYRSLASRTIDRADPDPVGGAQYLASSLTNLSSLTARTFSVLTPKVEAQSRPYDFGFPRYGFSKEDLNNPLMEDPYDNAEKAANILSKNESYIERARNCFGVEITNDPSNGWEVNVAKNPDGDPEKEVIPSTKKYIDAKCAEGSNDWLRIRLFIFDSRTMEAYACYDGADDACEGVEDDDSAAVESDNGTSETSSTEKVDVSKIGTNSDKVKCAEGSDDLGVVTTKYTGVYKKESGPLKIRLCQIPGIPGQGNNKSGGITSGGAVVDARLSGVWVAIAKKAKSDGVSLTSSSSFRLADSCGGTGDGVRCARPGQSFHQTGLAIDFGEMGGFTPTGSSTSCSGRMTWDSKEYKWMRANAEEFGIKQYSAESWHWDPMQTENRCGKNDG